MNCIWTATLAISLFVFIRTVGSEVLLSSERDENTLVWCTVNFEEQRKCQDIREFLSRDTSFDFDYGRRSDTFLLNCTQAYNKDQCMVMLDNNLADITTLDPGEVFVGGRYHSLVPILEEVYHVEGTGTIPRIYAVAVIKKSAEIYSLRDIRGKRACFGGVGTLAGWVLPIHKMMTDGGMEIVDCNNHVKSALEFFGPSCSVNSLSDEYNPLGDNSDKLCEICGSDLPGVKCSSSDPYAGYEGALNCLMDKGEIAFLKHSSINEYFQASSFTDSKNLDTNKDSFSFNQAQSSTQRSFDFPFGNQNNQNQNNFTSPFGGSSNRNFDGRQNFNGQGRNFVDDRSNSIDQNTNANRNHAFLRSRGPKTLTEFKLQYELLCPDGSRSSVDEWRSCNWAQIPAHAVVTSSAKSSNLRRRYQKYLQSTVRKFGGPGSVGDNENIGGSGDRRNQNQPNSQNSLNSAINLFESVPRYGNRSNLLFQDATVSLRSITEQDQTYVSYLGENMKAIMEIRSCPVGRMTLCVTSQAEMDKCVKMRTALNAQLLKPEMSCYKAHSHINCMQAIQNGLADVAVFDAGDVYTAGYKYHLVPVLSEIYNLGEPEYYAVAVAYQGDADTELTYLKGKYSCHSGIGHAAGWIVPMAYLISSGRMREYGCDSLKAASQYFTKSCVPGALSNEYNFGEQYNNLCDLCRGSSFSYCSRDASEDFYGYTGAFRCLIEGGGQVAFVKHTTVSEVTDGKRREFWARNTLSGDYELLCRDGTRAPVTDYTRCNLGKVKANAVVVRGNNETETNAIINLFLYAQQFYGRKLEDDFSFAMFYSPPPFSDLIFQDAAQQLQIIPPQQRYYRRYLGKNFLKARALVDCNAGVNNLQIGVPVLALLTISLLLQHMTLL